MNPHEVFEVWKAQKSEGDAGPEFTDQVMAAVRRREMGSALKIIFRSHGWLSPLRLKRNLRADPRSPRSPRSPGDVGPEFTGRVMAALRRRDATRVIGAPLREIAARPWAKAAALILGTLLGLARIIATLHLILFA